ncbi:uncharacterized protein PHACADRAFT_261798 [Phanerochaete carnosa HHB-10118-sp]|uniref:Polysaccharide lyase family 14 protein n=1 Tax=Phanerochaete carnosa (strain HHB-10118-sp) TaxID=650164 RepID=K5UP80_PHACS|nr:uncharacterized protein PHACADRAFT_261798 [Phanerochaete carnosa HHB-10118-sp]EKM51576.1 hypothetical protein PHACADRAFT_261798 [Phanerochaete carnosa HHB-10118-sp]
MASTLLVLLLCTPIPSLTTHVRGPPPGPLHRRSNVPPEGYFDPLNNGGSMLTQVPGTFPAGLGEPINVIISEDSDSDVLKNQETDGGMLNYFLSFGYATECLGQHSGDDQAANLGDGNGYLNETAVIRWDYGDPQLGSCRETIDGGAHFRIWVQNGNEADSGAVFVAASYEESLADEHDIIYNGYNLGRDWMIGNATNQSSIIPTSNVTNQTTYNGQTSFGGYTYETNVKYISGLLQNTSQGINHYLTVGGNGVNAVDGLVAVMQVSIVERPATSGVGHISAPSVQAWLLFALVALSFPPSLF